MKRLMYLLCLLLMFSTAHAEEGELKIGLHTLSLHVPEKDYQNNDNWGLSAQYKQWRVGAYRNTLNRTSIYGGYVHDLGYGFDVMGGLVSGYQKKCQAIYTQVTQKYMNMETGQLYDVIESYHTRTDCYGSSRGAVTVMLAFSYTAPAKFFGLQPKLTVIPPYPKHSLVVHGELVYSFDAW